MHRSAAKTPTRRPRKWSAAPEVARRWSRVARERYGLVLPAGDVPRTGWDDAGRPRPGLDDRVWDHDPVALFANVYRLGPRHQFDPAALLAELARLRPQAPPEPEASPDDRPILADVVRPLHAQAGPDEADPVRLPASPPDPGERPAGEV